MTDTVGGSVVPVGGRSGAVTVLRYAAFPDTGPGVAGESAGNPAGVVLDAGDLTDTDRLSIAAQVDYSETAFVEPLGERRHRLRFFSPQAAVAFCGHATIATAVVLAERDGPGEMLFETLAGEIAVTTEEGERGLEATLTSVPTRTRAMRTEELDEILPTLGWHRRDLDERYPPHVAYAGNDHPILVTHDAGALAGLTYDFASLAALMRTRGWTTVHVAHAESPTRFRARGLFPPGGVVEDPATGSAAAAFGGYLRRLGLATAPVTVTVLQGHDMGRPSRIDVDLLPDDDRVRVRGTAVPVAAGTERPAERPAPAPPVVRELPSQATSSRLRAVR